MNKRAIRKMLYRDVATIIGKDDDLMPPMGDWREQKAWLEARDDLVKELERRGRMERGRK